MEEWYQNPETFYHEQDSVLWSERLRPCAEALYIVLFENHSQVCPFDDLWCKFDLSLMHLHACN